MIKSVVFMRHNFVIDQIIPEFAFNVDIAIDFEIKLRSLSFLVVVVLDYVIKR